MSGWHSEAIRLACQSHTLSDCTEDEEAHLTDKSNDISIKGWEE